MLKRLPWWAILLIGIVLTCFSWFYPLTLHSEISLLFARPLEPITRPLGFFMLFLFGLLSLLMYLLDRRDRQTFNRTQSLDNVQTLSWRRFERLVSELFCRQGYRVTVRGGDGADGGVDIEARRPSEHVVVQCKHWRKQHVGVKTIRELYGVMIHEHATSATCVTCGDYTEEALAFAKGKPLQLINGRQLLRLITDIKQNKKQNIQEIFSPESDPSASSSTDALPVCPQCGSAMVLRTAQKGEHRGQQFWGCSRFPQCQGILPLDHQ